MMQADSIIQTRLEAGGGGQEGGCGRLLAREGLWQAKEARARLHATAVARLALGGMCPLSASSSKGREGRPGPCPDPSVP